MGASIPFSQFLCCEGECYHQHVMAKFKAAKGKSGRKAPSRGAIPCVIFIVSAIVLLGMLFYSILKSS